MIFQHTWKLILDGKKTQTRRLVTPNTGFTAHAEGAHVTYTSAGRYEVGKTYAVQPGRGQKAVGRIRIARIGREDVRDISDADVAAEGFGEDKDAFLETWCEMHDPGILRLYTALYRRGWLQDRPAERYDAVVYEFEVVK